MDLDFAYAEGFIREWLKTSPKQVQDNFDIIVDKLKYYQDKIEQQEQEYNNLYRQYQELAGRVLEFMKSKTEQIPVQFSTEDENNLE